MKSSKTKRAMPKLVYVCALFFMSVYRTSCGGQNKPDLPKDNIKSETKDIDTSWRAYIMVHNIKKAEI